jgi:hypothetical protein
MFPIVDAMTNDTLATDEDQRVMLVGMLVDELVFAKKAALRIGEVQRLLKLLMVLGESVPVGDWAVACELGNKPARSVDRQEIEAHSEALAPLGLAPREEMKIQTIFPGVGAFTTKEARAALARAGLTADSFLISGGDPVPQVIIYQPKEER